MQHPVPFRGRKAPRESGRAHGAGVSLGDAQKESGQYLEPAVCRWRWPGRDQEIPGTLLQPFPPLMSQLSLAPGRAGWPGFPAKVGDKLPWFVPEASLPALGWVRVLSVCPCVLGWVRRGGKCFPRGSRSCPSLPLCWWRAAPQPGLEQQHIETSASEGGQTSQGCCCSRASLPARQNLGTALPGTSLSANIQWQSWEPALAFPYDPGSDHSSLPAPSQPPLPLF